MNIVKLKDIVKPGDDLFNKHLKGKYAYWVHMRYIVSFDHMKHEGYVACEEDINKLLKDSEGNFPKPYGAPYIDIYETDMTRYIDIYETDKINNIVKYRLQNNFTSDNNITIDELKKFRTWLATNLLMFDLDVYDNPSNTIFNDHDTHILSYYKSGMYNDTVRILSIFGNSEPQLVDLTASTCGCDSNWSSLYTTQVSACDPLYIYKHNIYKEMVDMFSNIDFWTQFPQEFILEFKKYIDNIIKCNFPLTKSQYVSDYADCGCDMKDNQELMINILKRLSQSLQYIAEGNMMGHKNYIRDAFKDWSTNLYELMEW